MRIMMYSESSGKNESIHTGLVFGHNLLKSQAKE